MSRLIDYSEVEDVLDAYLDDGTYIGQTQRKIVHDAGFWHHAIHCWVYFVNDDSKYIVFQKRKSTKRLFPEKYDVAAAGHYITGEFGKEGLRELTEELSLPLSDYSIRFWKMMRCSFRNEVITNNEFCNVYLCELKNIQDTFVFDEKEIEDVIVVEASSCLSLLLEQTNSIKAYSTKCSSKIRIYKKDFVEESISYFVDTVKYLLENKSVCNVEDKNYTFVMLKPDAIKRNLVTKIVRFLVDKGYTIELFDVKGVEDEKIYSHYEEKIKEEGDIYKMKAYRYFHGQQVVPMVLSHNDERIIWMTREYIGFKDPQQAKKDTIRGRWGIDSMECSEKEERCCENLIHASDSYASFKREVSLWFDRESIEKFFV